MLILSNILLIEILSTFELTNFKFKNMVQFWCSSCECIVYCHCVYILSLFLRFSPIQNILPILMLNTLLSYFYQFALIKIQWWERTSSYEQIQFSRNELELSSYLCWTWTFLVCSSTIYLHGPYLFIL